MDVAYEYERNLPDAWTWGLPSLDVGSNSWGFACKYRDPCVGLVMEAKKKKLSRLQMTNEFGIAPV